jgi:hypothetical protein
VNTGTVPIPKKIHISWLDESIFEHESPIARYGVQKMLELNPGWDVELSTESSVDKYLKEELGLHTWRLLEGTHIVERLDVWRLIKLYNEGGMYIDVDRLYNVPMDELLDPSVSCVLATGEDFDFSHDMMITAPHNPIYSTALELTLGRRRSGIRGTYALGPQTYMHAVTMVLTGKMIDSNPGDEKFNELRNTIQNIPFLSTFREEVPYNTFVFRPERGQEQFDHEAEKRKFYGSYGLKHWTQEW